MSKSIDTDRRLVAIFAADVEGYSRLMGADEVGTLRDLTRRRDILDALIASHGGRIANTAGDSVLAEFGSAVDAVQCAVEAQQALAAANAGLSSGRHINFRVGVHVGDVMVRGGDLFGDAVNISARLQTLASAGGVCLSGVAYDQVRKILPFAFVDLGAQQVKNIEEPVRAYAVSAAGVSAAPESASASAKEPLPPPDKPSIAVLPFQNISGDPEQEYFADGMVEEIITGLSRSKALFVIARNSSFTYKGKAVDIKHVGRELGVRYVLEGSVRKAGGRVRITGQLIDANTGAHVWADKFDGDLRDIFDTQDRVTSSVIGAISPQLERAEIARAERKPTDSLQAYDFYLRGLASNYRFDRASNIEALRLTRIANEIDPNFARAYALGSHCLVQRRAFGWSTDVIEERAEALRLSKKAIEVGNDDAIVLATIGQTLGVMAGELDEGAALLGRAIALDPNLAPARYWSGSNQLYLGNIEAAIGQYEIALRLSPLDSRIFVAQAGLATANFLAGRYEEGLSWAKAAIHRQPNFLLAQRTAMACHAKLGKLDEARRICAHAMEIDSSQRISDIGDRTPFRRSEDVEKLAEAFRIAGMPE